MNEQRFRFIFKEGRKWKVQHFDGQITYHKTKKAAKEYAKRTGKRITKKKRKRTRSKKRAYG